MNDFLTKLVSDKRMVFMLDTIFDGIYIVNLNREIVFWNKGAEKITGYTFDEVKGKKCSANILNHIDENGKLLCKSGCPLTYCIKTGINIEEKIYPLHKSGERFPVLTHVAPIKDNDGIVVGAIEVFRDVSKEEDFRIIQEKFNGFIQKYISKDTYEEILNQVKHGKSDLNVVRDLTILYLDIVGFTEFSENIDPNSIADLLNDLFGICGIITREFHGDIDKFIGDSIMATFLDANDAVNASKKILEALDHFNKIRENKELRKIQLRLGINSGNVVQVEIGTKDRKDYTVLGDVVNTASRIQSIADPDSIYISESTLARLTLDNEFSLVGSKKLKGKKESIKVYKYDSKN
jgi:PAS domain S-box-containing protein